MSPLTGGACASAPSRTTISGPARDSAQATSGEALHQRPTEPFPSAYVPFHPARGDSKRQLSPLPSADRNGAILLENGKIAAVGATVNAPANALVIDGAGKYVTPGIIDDHSHLGVYAAPGGNALSDGNESTSPATPQVWAEHSVWPQDPQFPRNLAGGVTTLQVLPGSANLIGGRSVVLKVVPGRTVQAMKFPGAKYGLKMACGENPKRSYASRGGPATRMGNASPAIARTGSAARVPAQVGQWNADHKGDPPTRASGARHWRSARRGTFWSTITAIAPTRGAQMIDIAHEFGYKIRYFHHG